MKPTYDKIGGIPDATVEFGPVIGGEAQTDIVGGKAVITTDPGAWSIAEAPEQIRLLAHEYVHPIQFNQLGRWGTYGRRLLGTVTYGPHEQYAVPDAILDIPLGGFSVVDPRFPLEGIASRIADFVPKGPL